MQKILLISDTHGKLDTINEKILQTKADFVIHAGDFGFYNEPSIFVSHVSPGKEPLLTRLMLHFMPNFWISGHMGAPFSCVWNQFTIHDMNEAIDWLQVDTAFIKEQYKLGHLSEEAILAYEIIIRDIPKKDDWFKKMWNINLPDAKNGHAILTVKDGRFSLETYSSGIQICN